MDKKKGLLNVTVSISFKVIFLIVGIMVRRFIIKYLGDEVNGLNSLYISLLDFLSVAELGVGAAITFCIYKPIVENETKKVSALYHLFTKLYLIIGAIIAAGGCIIMPFLKHLVKDYQNLNVNLYLTFALMLISVVVTYLYSSKSSLINAYKNNYITTTISNVAMLIQNVLQIIVLIYTQSFVWFLVCRIIGSALQWVATEIFARKKHGDIIKNRQKIDKQTRKEVVKSVKAMFMHKIGGVLVNTADSVIISAFIGAALLGKYSNYTAIMVSMVSAITLFFTPLTSVIGHMCVEQDTEEVKRYLNFFHTFNFILGAVFFLGYYATIDNLVTICFGENLELAKTISLVITLNYFIQFIRQATLLFRDATGTFYNDRWKPLFEGIVNIALSILFVKIFPEEYNIVGVIVATIITTLFICHVVEPYVLYKHALKARPIRYYIKNYVYIIAFAVALAALHFSMRTFDNEWVELLVNGTIAVAIAIVPSVIALAADKDFRHFFKVYANKIKSKLKKKEPLPVTDNGAIAEGQGDGQLNPEPVRQENSRKSKRRNRRRNHKRKMNKRNNKRK